MDRGTRSVIFLGLGALYGFLSGNTQARQKVFGTIQSLAGMGIDALSRLGDKHVSIPNPIEPVGEIQVEAE